MKKFLLIAMAIALVGAFANTAKAYDGDFEISGHINTGFGFQYNSKAAAAGALGAFREEGMIPPNVSVNAQNQITNNFNLVFYVGDVELDIAKTFGENIRLRVDLDFGLANVNSYGPAIANIIEQAYTTINIPVGYGLEFLVGRFNAPMGFEAVDNNDNDLPFHTAIFNYLRPQHLTGLKFYYPFSDLVDLHFYIVQNLRDVQNENGANIGTHIPAGGLRLGFTFGNEGQESTLGISGAFSPEAKLAGVKDKWGELSYIGDLDFNFWVNDVFAIGGEVFFRRDGKYNNAANITNKSNYYYAGLLNLHYMFSDVWDGTLRYTYSFDKTGSAALLGRGAATVNTAPAAGVGGQYNRFGFPFSAMIDKLQLHQIDLGINYHITDGAKIMTMYRFEMAMPAKVGGRTYAIGNKTAMNHSLAANFAYEF